MVFVFLLSASSYLECGLCEGRALWPCSANSLRGGAGFSYSFCIMKQEENNFPKVTPSAQGDVVQPSSYKQKVAPRKQLRFQASLLLYKSEMWSEQRRENYSLPLPSGQLLQLPALSSCSPMGSVASLMLEATHRF